MKQPSRTRRSTGTHRRSLLHRATALLLLVSFIHVTGCTVIGYGTGFRIDHKQSDLVPLQDWSQLEEGDWVLVTTRSGDEYDGQLLAIAPCDSIQLSYLKPGEPRLPRSHKPNSYAKVVLDWSSIEQMQRRDIPVRGRAILTPLGLIIDGVVGYKVAGYLLVMLAFGGIF